MAVDIDKVMERLKTNYHDIEPAMAAPGLQPNRETTMTTDLCDTCAKDLRSCGSPTLTLVRDINPSAKGADADTVLWCTGYAPKDLAARLVEAEAILTDLASVRWVTALDDQSFRFGSCARMGQRVLGYWKRWNEESEVAT